MDRKEFIDKAIPFALGRNTSTDRKVFAELVSAGRKLAKLTQYELAQELHTGAGTISRWENGHSAPPMKARKAIVYELLCNVYATVIDSKEWGS